jgi:hypothetical protein
MLTASAFTLSICQYNGAQGAQPHLTERRRDGREAPFRPSEYLPCVEEHARVLNA